MSIIKMSQIQKKTGIHQALFPNTITMKNWKQPQYVTEKWLNIGIVIQYYIYIKSDDYENQGKDTWNY